MDIKISDMFWTTNTYNPFRYPDFVKRLYPTVSEYVTQFLCAQHPYRKGAMCPFVPPALKKDHIFYAYIDSFNRSNSTKIVLEYVDYYLILKKQSEAFASSLIILFENSFPIEDLLEIQYQCKETCVQKFLMIGAMYPTSQAPSLHNAAYFPMRTPSPVLVVRDLTASDLMFLNPNRYNVSKRVIFLKSFIKRFVTSKSATTLQQIEKAKDLLGNYEKYIFAKRIIILFFILIIIATTLHAIFK